MKLDQVIELAALRAFPDCYRRALAILDEEPCDMEQLAERMNTGVNNAYKTLARLRALKVICIVEYRYVEVDKNPRRVYGIGSKDIKKPRPLSREEINRRHREKVRLASRPATLGAFGL